MSKKIKKSFSKTSKTKKEIPKTKKKSKIIEDDFSMSEISEDSIENEVISKKNEVEDNIKNDAFESLIIEMTDDSKKDRAINKKLDQEAKNKGEQGVITTIKKTKKQATIDTILDAYEKLNLPEVERSSAASLKGEKLNILEKKLAILTERIAKEILNTPKPVEPGQENGNVSDDVAVIALYNVNIMMTQFVETLAEVGRNNESTEGYIPDIQGVTQRLLDEQKSKQLKQCLKDIIAQHGDAIKPFLSPISVWVFFMISNMSEQIAENEFRKLHKDIEKKKENT